MSAPAPDAAPAATHAVPTVTPPSPAHPPAASPPAAAHPPPTSPPLSVPASSHTASSPTVSKTIKRSPGGAITSPSIATSKAKKAADDKLKADKAKALERKSASKPTVETSDKSDDSKSSGSKTPKTTTRRSIGSSASSVSGDSRGHSPPRSRSRPRSSGSSTAGSTASVTAKAAGTKDKAADKDKDKETKETTSSGSKTPRESSHPPVSISRYQGRSRSVAADSRGSTPGSRSPSSSSGRLTPRNPRSRSPIPKAIRSAPNPIEHEKLKESNKILQSQLAASQKEVEDLKASIHEGMLKRQELDKVLADLRAEVEKEKVLARESIATFQEKQNATIEQLQNAVLEYQNKYDEMKRAKRESIFSRNDEELKLRVDDLEACVLELRKQNDTLKARKDPDISNFTKRIEELQHSVLEYQDRYDTLKKKNFQLLQAQQASSRRDQTEQLTEQVQNLQFHLLYGATDKDKEIEVLRGKMTSAESDLAVINKLRRKYGKMRDKAIEDWLFSGDVAEAL